MSYINALCAVAREFGMKCAPSLPRSLLVYPLASSQSASWLQRDVRKEEPDVGKHEERTEYLSTPGLLTEAGSVLFACIILVLLCATNSACAVNATANYLRYK